MNTVVLWLLVSVGNYSYNNSSPTMVVERFATREDCVRVADFLNKARPIHTCVDAKVIAK